MAKAKVRPLWYVNAIEVAEDPNKSHIYTDTQPQQDEIAQQAPQPARNRRDIPQPIGLDDVPNNRQANGYGFHMARGTHVSTAFTTAVAAVEYAKELASKNPKTAYGVYSCVGVFETTAPSIIEKKFNDSGELVLIQTEEKVDVSIE